MSPSTAGATRTELEGLLAEGRFDELERELNRALEREPDSPGLLRLSARAASAHGDLPLARQRWAELRRQHPNDEVGSLEGARIASRLGLPEEAAQLWEALLQRRPDHPVVLASMAQAALDADEVAVAAGHWLKVAPATQEATVYRTGAAILLRLLTTMADEPALAAEITRRMLQQPPGDGNGFTPEVCVRARPLVRPPRHQGTYRRLRAQVLEALPEAPATDETGSTPRGAVLTTPEICRVFFDSPDDGFGVALRALLSDSSRERLLLVFSSPSKRKTAVLEAYVRALSASPPAQIDGDHLYDLALLTSAYSDSALERILGLAVRPDSVEMSRQEAVEVLRRIERARATRTQRPEPRSAVGRDIRGRIGAVSRRTRTMIRTWLPRERLRIAICVSGQLRGYDRAFPTWRSLGLAHHDVSYFVHVWRDVGRKELRPDHAERVFSGRFLDAFVAHASGMSMQVLRERYPSLVAMGAAGEVVTEPMLEQHYGSQHVRVEDDGAPEFADFSNQQKMSYKIAAAHRLYRESGSAADVVVRIRPDKPVSAARGLDWAGLRADSRARRLLFADVGTTIAAVYSVGDQVAIGVPEVMDHYAASYQDTLTALAQGRYGYPHGFHPHQNIAYSLFQSGITARTLPGVRSEPPLDPSAIGAGRVLAALEADTAGRQQTSLDRALLEAARADADALGPRAGEA